MELGKIKTTFTKKKHDKNIFKNARRGRECLITQLATTVECNYFIFADD